MVGIILAFVLGAAVAARAHAKASRCGDGRLLPVVMTGFGIRLLASQIVTDLPVFSYGAGGDSYAYDQQARAILTIWQFTGLQYVDDTLVGSMGPTSFPGNLFALVGYLNGEMTRIGCVAVVAMLACLVALTVHTVALELGAARDAAFALVCVVLFTPSFLMFSSDTYKEAIVLFFEFEILAAALRLSRRTTAADLLIAALCLLGLRFTRFYLTYVLAVPLVLATFGLRSRSIPRMVLTALVLGTIGVIAIVYSHRFDGLAENFNTTVQTATAENALEDNARGGSGVMFDPSNPFGSFVPKLVYTLLSPFPWQSGSIALQVGKLEVVAWYFFLYRAIRFLPTVWRAHRTELLIMASFIGPVLLAYTLGFSNVGLVMRERFGAVVAVTTLACATWREKRRDPVFESTIPGEAPLEAPSGGKRLPLRA